jgi:hypothetical protein
LWAPGDDAVARGVHAGQVSAHLPVNGNRALDTEVCAGGGGELGVGPDAHDDQDHVNGTGHGVPVRRPGLDAEPCRAPGCRAADRGDGGAGQDLDALAGELAVDKCSQVRVDGGKYLGQLLDLGDGQPSGGEGVGHFQADIAGADDHRAGGRSLLQRAHDGKGVTHRVQQVDTVIVAERCGAAETLDRWPRRHGSRADQQLVVGQ